MSSITLAIGETSVRQHDGLFSLNDLHRASGNEPKHQPALFMRMDSTKALISEIEKSTESQSFKTVKGRIGGTYACRELVIAYAAWINAAFHLKVIRVFLNATSTPALPPAPPRRNFVRGTVVGLSITARIQSGNMTFAMALPADAFVKSGIGTGDDIELDFKLGDNPLVSSPVSICRASATRNSSFL